VIVGERPVNVEDRRLHAHLTIRFGRNGRNEPELKRKLKTRVKGDKSMKKFIFFVF
jgi:hypothetical protein